MEPLGGIEPPTYALPRRRYTAKPQRLKNEVDRCELILIIKLDPFGKVKRGIAEGGNENIERWRGGNEAGGYENMGRWRGGNEAGGYENMGRGKGGDW